MAEHSRITAVGGAEPDTARWLAGMGRALCDPVRARILLLLAQGRACCEGLERQAPAQVDDGVCVCELEEVLGLRQSLVSYHLRQLKEAGLVRENRCGRWSYYSLDREAVRQLAGTLSALAQIPPSLPTGGPPAGGGDQGGSGREPAEGCGDEAAPTCCE